MYLTGSTRSDENHRHPLLAPTTDYHHLLQGDHLAQDQRTLEEGVRIRTKETASESPARRTRIREGCCTAIALCRPAVAPRRSVVTPRYHALPLLDLLLESSASSHICCSACSRSWNQYRGKKVQFHSGLWIE